MVAKDHRSENRNRSRNAIDGPMATLVLASELGK
jgi:hypothetical protein